MILRHASGQPRQELTDRDDVRREELRVDDRLRRAEAAQHRLPVGGDEDVIGPQGTVRHTHCVQVSDGVCDRRNEVEAAAKVLGHLIRSRMFTRGSQDQFGAIGIGGERDDRDHARMGAAS